jgi:hypothetical protein
VKKLGADKLNEYLENFTDEELKEEIETRKALRAAPKISEEAKKVLPKKIIDLFKDYPKVLAGDEQGDAECVEAEILNAILEFVYGKEFFYWAERL